DEHSLVQTRFATTVFALVRAHIGQSIELAAADAEDALEAPLPDPPAGSVVGLAREAALKVREAAALPTEAHPALEFRHGPISAADRSTLVWALGPIPSALAADLERASRDPLAELVRVQRFAVRAAIAAGRDPDDPPHISRSVVVP